MNKKPFNWGEWIEKYRFWIGGGLLFLILAGAGFQLYRENYGKENLADRVKSQEERVNQLESKYEALSTKYQTNSASRDSSATTQNDSGVIAGTSAQNTGSSGILKQVQDDNKVTGKININTASASELDALPGIGAVYSQRIVDYRNANGGFKSTDEIKNVKGIGDKTFEKFREQITI